MRFNFAIFGFCVILGTRAQDGSLRDSLGDSIKEFNPFISNQPNHREMFPPSSNDVGASDESQYVNLSQDGDNRALPNPINTNGVNVFDYSFENILVDEFRETIENISIQFYKLKKDFRKIMCQDKSSKRNIISSYLSVNLDSIKQHLIVAKNLQKSFENQLEDLKNSVILDLIKKIEYLSEYLEPITYKYDSIDYYISQCDKYYGIMNVLRAEEYREIVREISIFHNAARF
ncbi:hypothetical protein AYI68_g6223 [Smittium mucronatum]|uniref:Uncharacterized protein n=1 Tax=Smittium mucronatum TaxID=133383 RepID=A0A1R0GS52_9FUNG|nr:hypothetical protein AYI68_g6223 [Smittium mucronatum]